jgi:hypothetical protein
MCTALAGRHVFRAADNLGVIDVQNLLSHGEYSIFFGI